MNRFPSLRIFAKDLFILYITIFSNIKTFTQFEAYYVMSDMKWFDCIKSHHKGLGQVKTCFRMGKKDEIEKEGGKEKKKKGEIIGRIV